MALAVYADVIDGLTGQWTVGDPLPTSAPISPYYQAAGGGVAIPSAPVQPRPVGGPTSVLDAAYEAETYTTATGARAWRSTAADDALIDAVTTNPYTGLDELNAARAAGYTGRSASGVARALPYVGEVVGGVVEGATVYGETGSLTHATFAGGGATLGSIAGSTIGGALGAVGGPVGVAVGAVAGGALGSVIGSAIGQGLANLIDPLEPNNKNGAQYQSGTRPFNATDGGDFTAYGGVTINFYSQNNGRYITRAVLAYYVYNTEYGPAINYTNCDGSPVNNGPNLLPETLSIVGSGSCVSGLPQFDPNNFPIPTYDTYKPTKTAPIAPRLPAIRLPQPIPFPRIGLPRGWPTGPTPNPAPNPDPGPEPNPGPDDHDKPGYKHPDPNPTDDPVNPNPTEQPGPDDGTCDPCAELAAIRAKLEETFSLAWALPECNKDFSINREGEKEGQGLAGLSQKIDGLYQVLRVLHNNTRCNDDSFVVVPDSWPMKVESGRPQLVLIYATKNPDKTWGSRRYQFCIPHFDEKLRKALKTLLPKDIKKGSQQGTYTLADNSKIITYCKTKTEALRVINAFDKLVLKPMKTNNKKSGEINPNTKFLELILQPYEARYFSQGQHNLTPDWKDKLY